MQQSLKQKKTAAEKYKTNILAPAFNLGLKAFFNQIKENGTDYATEKQIRLAFSNAGLEVPDGLKKVFQTLNQDRKNCLNEKEFVKAVATDLGLIERMAKDEFIIERFFDFRDKLETTFEATRKNKGGSVADYIPQLARVNPDMFGLSVCTIDGQRADFGDAEKNFCVQSACKPINYALALTLNGVDKVHEHVGREPSGQSFNELALNPKGLPHNPMINAGAIMSCALIHPNWPAGDRFDFVMKTWQDLSGGVEPRFSNPTFLSEKETADRNYALAHFMREKRAFPSDTNLPETLDFYFQSCSIEISTRSMASIAATFANGGVNPVTSKRVFSEETVRHCLSLMYSCGMYDFSGEFAFTIGLPAKSGVSGVMMVVVPGVLGFAVWSPRLDALGNSVRGVDFCHRFSKAINLESYGGMDAGKGWRRKILKNDPSSVFKIIQASAQNDVHEIRKLLASSVNVNAADYDGRTPLHLAAAEGAEEAVKYLLDCGADPSLEDRWGVTAQQEIKGTKLEVLFQIFSAKKSS